MTTPRPLELFERPVWQLHAVVPGHFAYEVELHLGGLRGFAARADSHENRSPHYQRAFAIEQDRVVLGYRYAPSCRHPAVALNFMLATARYNLGGITPTNLAEGF